MARVVLAAQVVHVGGADERPADLARDPRDALVRAVLLGDLVVLELEVDVLRRRGPPSGRRRGRARLAGAPATSRWQKRD